jgi:hypothetical protein
MRWLPCGLLAMTTIVSCGSAPKPADETVVAIHEVSAPSAMPSAAVEPPPEKVVRSTPPPRKEPEVGAYEPIGVAECDEYLARARECFGRVPVAMLEPLTKAIETQTEDFRKIAQTSSGRADLVIACQNLLLGLSKNPACKDP